MYEGEYEYHAAMAAQAEAEAQAMQAYEDYLGKLLDTEQYPLFAAHVAEDWLTSHEFAKSGLTALEYIRKMKDKFSKPISEVQSF